MPYRRRAYQNSNSMTPFFSIIIPVYNVSPYLRECLDSVLAQTFTDWEAICVDDGSIDGSGVILDEYASRDSRFRVIHQPNVGVSVARNLGIRTASGAYVGFIDPDDVVDAKWLSVAEVELHREDPDLLRLNFMYYSADEESDTPVIGEKYDITIYKARNEILPWGWQTFGEIGFCWLLFIKRAVLVNMGNRWWFPENLRVREDNIFALRILPFLEKVVQCTYSGYLYRQRGDSAVSKSCSLHDAFAFRWYMMRLWANVSAEVSSCPEFENIVGVYKQQIDNCLIWDWKSRIFRYIVKLSNLLHIGL